MRRDVILSLELPKGHEDRILGLLVDLCDFVEKWKDADLIDDYGLCLVTPMLEIKELPTHVGSYPDLSEEVQDARNKIIKRGDQR